MARVVASFEASEDELHRLSRAVLAHCECNLECPDYACPSHSILRDESLVKHLIFVSRNLRTYQLAEFRGPR